MNVVFMGTPDFAVPCLKSLIENNYNVVGVFTKPDKPKGRGYKLTSTPVKQQALEYNINVYQPETLKNDEQFNLLKELNPDVIVVVAYGQILPKTILELPKYGCINVHASLLPKYRGAGPIQWSIINGEKVTGVTTMLMDVGVDTGDMLLKSQTNIEPNETASMLHDRLSIIGANALIETLNKIQEKDKIRQKQDDENSTYAPMLSKKLSNIDFNKPAQQVHDLIRGLSTWPCAQTKLNNKNLKIYKSKIALGFKGNIGEILDEKRFIVGCQDNAVEFIEVQCEGGKKMIVQDFLRGNKIKKGDYLG